MTQSDANASTAQNQNMLLMEKRGAVMLMTLNRPDANNALNAELTLALVNGFEVAERDAEVRAVVLTGAGRAFCAGVDLKALTDNPDILTGGGLGPEAPMVVAMDQCTKPIIAAVNGPAVTGGFELALACDFMYASPTARFADTHARVGILPGWGLSQKLSRIIGIQRAREMSLTGNFISADQALAWGLVNRICESDLLIEKALECAQQIAESDASAVGALKCLINDGWRQPLADALVLEGERSNEFVKTVDFSAMSARLEALRARAKR